MADPPNTRGNKKQKRLDQKLATAFTEDEWDSAIDEAKEANPRQARALKNLASFNQDPVDTTSLQSYQWGGAGYAAPQGAIPAPKPRAAIRAATAAAAGESALKETSSPARGRKRGRRGSRSKARARAINPQDTPRTTRLKKYKGREVVFAREDTPPPAAAKPSQMAGHARVVAAADPVGDMGAQSATSKRKRAGRSRIPDAEQSEAAAMSPPAKKVKIADSTTQFVDLEEE